MEFVDTPGIKFDLIRSGKDAYKGSEDVEVLRRQYTQLRQDGIVRLLLADQKAKPLLPYSETDFSALDGYLLVFGDAIESKQIALALLHALLAKGAAVPNAKVFVVGLLRGRLQKLDSKSSDTELPRPKTDDEGLLNEIFNAERTMQTLFQMARGSASVVPGRPVQSYLARLPHFADRVVILDTPVLPESGAGLDKLLSAVFSKVPNPSARAGASGKERSCKVPDCVIC